LNAPFGGVVPSPRGEVVSVVLFEGARSLIDKLMQQFRARRVDDDVGVVCETPIGFWLSRLHRFGVTAAVEAAINRDVGAIGDPKGVDQLR
jgi:hypothetical protein